MMQTHYFLMHRDSVITAVMFDEAGQMTHFARPEHENAAPLKYRYRPTWLKDWWKERAVPFTQDRIPQFLKEKGFVSAEDYLIRNLGLSLSDQYWVRPADSDLQWKDVSLYSNNFRKNVFFFHQKENDSHTDPVPHLSPDGSLQGDIEKTWIIRDGERWLVKGNHGNLSAESLNELIATELHKKQGYRNYVQYLPIHINGKAYEYGCCCKAFTSEEIEAVAAWDIYTAEKKPNGISDYEHFLNGCRKLGLNEELLQQEMDYRIMCDFVMSGYDRHLNNIAVLRDPITLEYKGLSPVYDSGGCLFAGKQKPKSEKDLLKIKINSFTATERTQISLVRDYSQIDLTKLPHPSFVRKIYEKDPQMREEDISAITYGYEKKIEICRAIQRGRDPWKKQYAISSPER